MFFLYYKRLILGYPHVWQPPYEECLEDHPTQSVASQWGYKLLVSGIIPLGELTDLSSEVG